jgi:hypothetical protein
MKENNKPTEQDITEAITMSTKLAESMALCKLKLNHGKEYRQLCKKYCAMLTDVFKYYPHEDLTNPELFADIIASNNTSALLKDKTNEDIAQLALEHLWSHIDAFTPQSDLLEEMIERLKEHDGKTTCMGSANGKEGETTIQ